MLGVPEKLHATEKSKTQKSKSKRETKTEMSTRHADLDQSELAWMNCGRVLPCNSPTVWDTESETISQASF